MPDKGQLKMEITPKKRALHCIVGNRHKADRISALDPLTTATVEQMLNVKAPFPAAHKDPILHAKLAAAAWEIIGLEGFKIPFDLCLQAEALGAKIDYGRIDVHPSIKEHAFKDLKELKMPEKFLEKGRIPVVSKATEILRKQYGDYLPIVRQTVGPMTIAGHIFGLENFCRWIKRKKPEEIEEALLILADLNIEELRDANKLGADLACIADPSASADIVSPSFFKQFLAPSYRKICSKLSIPVILHICGNTSVFLPYIKETGIDAFSCDAQIDIAFAKKIMQDNIAIVGNVPTISVLLMGSKEKVREAAISCIIKGTDVLAPSCGVPPRTSTENLQVIPEVARCQIKL